jgi:hypothetical protein
MLYPRALATLAVAIAAVFALTSVASAATSAKLDLKLSPGTAGTKKKPSGKKLNFHLTQTTDDGTSPPTFSTVVAYLGKGLRFNYTKFPKCSNSTLNSKGPSACPKGSKVGTGSALALVGGSPGEPAPTTTETLKVTAYNGGSGKYELWLDGDTPANIKQALEGTLSTATGDFAWKLTVPIPANLQQPVPGLFAPVIDFKVNTGATITKKKGRKKVKYNYIETTGCTGGSWKFRADITYVNSDTPLAPETSQSC